MSETPVFVAQAAGGDVFGLVMPLLFFVLIFYFLIFRPQRQQMKQRQEMLGNIRRNDTVVTGGGIIGKVTKVFDEDEVEVEIAKGVKTRVARSMIADVRVKGEPVKK